MARRKPDDAVQFTDAEQRVVTTRDGRRLLRAPRKPIEVAENDRFVNVSGLKRPVSEISTAVEERVEETSMVSDPETETRRAAAPQWPPRYPGFHVHVHADGGVHYWRPGTDPDLNDVVSDDGG